MKHATILGLVAIAAVASMAFIRASTASAADRLCETATNPCTSPVLVNGIIKAEASDLTFTGDIETTCASSTQTLKVTKNDGSVNPTGEVTGLTMSGCKDLTHFDIGCTYTAQNLPWHFEIVTPDPNFTVRAHAGGSAPGWHVVCGGFLSCTVQRTSFSLPIDVGSPASITANVVELEKVAGGGLCPEEAFVDVKWVLESPTSSVFVTSS